MVVSRTVQLCSCVFPVVAMFIVCASCVNLLKHVTAWDENLEVARIADEPK